MSVPVTTPDLSQPLAIEELSIGKRRFAKADIRVCVGTEVREVPISEMLTAEQIEVEHVPVGRYVEVAPPIRWEGDTTIISLVEEVIERRLILKEEIHLRKIRTTRMHDETVTLREEKLTVERTSRTAPEGSDTVQDTGASNT